MRLSELIHGLPLRLAGGSAEVSVRELTDDSRQVGKLGPGCLFVARRGAKGDGGAFIRQAVEAGAAAVVCEEPGAASAGAVSVVVAPAVDQALAAELAERLFDRPSRKLRLIGVTGTNGKTTTTLLLSHLLNTAGLRCGMIGTVFIDDGKERTEAQLTTPGAIEMSRLLATMAGNGCRAAAMETSSHALHQRRTAALRFDAAVFTNLTGDHLDYHHTMEDYADAKALWFESLGPEAYAVVNVDDAYAERMVRDCRAKILRCTLNAAVHPDAECRATILHLGADHSVALYEGPWGGVELRLPLVGRHNVANVLEALASASAIADLDPTLCRALADCPPPPGRLEPVMVEGGEGPTVLVDYAHTHDALENVLNALRPVVTGKLIVVFGCGGDRDKTKRPKMAAVACRLADRVIVTSDNPRTEDPEAIICDILAGVGGAEVTVEADRAKAVEQAILAADDADTVLLAGKGHEPYQEIGTTRYPFDDRLQAAAALRKRASAMMNA